MKHDALQQYDIIWNNSSINVFPNSTPTVYKYWKKEIPAGKPKWNNSFMPNLLHDLFLSIVSLQLSLCLFLSVVTAAKKGTSTNIVNS